MQGENRTTPQIAANLSSFRRRRMDHPVPDVVALARVQMDACLAQSLEQDVATGLAHFRTEVQRLPLFVEQCRGSIRLAPRPASRDARQCFLQGLLVDYLAPSAQTGKIRVHAVVLKDANKNIGSRAPRKMWRSWRLTNRNQPEAPETHLCEGCVLHMDDSASSSLSRNSGARDFECTSKYLRFFRVMTSQMSLRNLHLHALH